MKRLIISMITIYYFTIGQPGLYAQDFAIKDYEFIWQVATVNNVSIRAQKTPERLGILLSSPGGRIATIFLKGSQAKAVGEVLLKAEEYHLSQLDRYKKQVKSFERDIVDTVPAGGHKVVFASTAQVKTLEIRLMQPKVFSPAVLMTMNEAIKVGKILLDAEEMVAVVSQRVRP